MSEGLLAVARLHHRAQDYPVNHHRAVAVLVLAEYPRNLGGGSVRPKRPGIYSQRGQRFPQLVKLLRRRSLVHTVNEWYFLLHRKSRRRFVRHQHELLDDPLCNSGGARLNVNAHAVFISDYLGL